MSLKKTIAVVAVIMVIFISGYLIYSDIARESSQTAGIEPDPSTVPPITEHSRSPDAVFDPASFEIPNEPGTTIRLRRLPNNDLILTNMADMTLYILASDPENASNCFDDCAEDHPPFVIGLSDNLVVGSGIEKGSVFLFERNGSTQVTYKNRALYTFKDDERPGDMKGASGDWEVATPF